MQLKNVWILCYQTLGNATAVAFLYATCTKPTSHKRLSIYLSSLSELTIKFAIIMKTTFFIWESYTCPLNKPAYVWPTQSTQCGSGCVFAKTKPQSIITMAPQ